MASTPGASTQTRLGKVSGLGCFRYKDEKMLFKLPAQPAGTGFFSHDHATQASTGT